MERMENLVKEMLSTEFAKEYILHGVIPIILNENSDRAKKYLENDALNDTFFADMRVFFVVRIADPEKDSEGFFVLSKQIAAVAGLSFTESVDKARENAQKAISFGRFMSIMYVATNDLGSFGTGCVLCREFLDGVFGMIGAFYLLPSSVHEWIIYPAKSEMDGSELDPDTLRGIVHDINQAEVAPCDFLSDHVLLFDGKNLKEA